MTAARSPEQTSRPAANHPDYLLDHARTCGLREAMHGVDPTTARRLLTAFVCLIDGERAAAKAEERNEWKEAVLDALAAWPGMDFPTTAPPRDIIAAVLKIEREAAAALAPSEPMTEPFMVTGTQQQAKCAILDAGHVLTYERAYELGQRFHLSSHSVQALAREIVATPTDAANDAEPATFSPEWFAKVGAATDGVAPAVAETRARLHSAIAKFGGQWPAVGDVLVFEGTAITRKQFEAVAA